jgi:hypothetical protein
MASPVIVTKQLFQHAGQGLEVSGMHAADQLAIDGDCELDRGPLLRPGGDRSSGLLLSPGGSAALHVPLFTFAQQAG